MHRRGFTVSVVGARVTGMDLLDTTDVRGVRWSWARSGSGPADVVFVHGFQNAREVWRPLLPALDPELFRATLVDLPGCGRSEPPPTWERSTIPELAADLAQLLHDLSITRPVLVGHSLGGAIALQMALTDPGLPSGLVLFAPASTRGLDFLPAGGVERLARPTPEDRIALLRAACHRPAPPGAMAELEQIVSRADPRHVEGAARSMDDFTVEARLGEIRVPTLVVAGDRDRHMPLRNHLATWGAIPRAGLHVMHGVGHVPFWEGVDESCHLLRQFLAEERVR
jgi:pimeloyl-ACP methyl ester carboxylesterase